MKKAIYHAPASCGGEYLVEFTEDNIPCLVCMKCNHSVNDWEKWYKTYSTYHQNPSAWESKKDVMVCLLGHFCEEYQKHYSMPYPLSLTEKGLFSGPEMVILRKILKSFDNDAIKTRDYITWIFQTKVEVRKKKITSLSFMMVADFIQQFNFAQKKARTITRDTQLPERMIAWINTNAPSLNDLFTLRDFNDLEMFLKAFKFGQVPPSTQIQDFVDKLKLAKYIDSNLEIVKER